jgi:aerobic carbon-monoxide dehydrogenase large subunit
MDAFTVAKAVRRTEDPRLLRGGGRYIDDIQLPGMVHGYLLRSPHAHARINKIDTSTARTAPGVLDIVTGADYVAAGLGAMPYIANPMPGFDPKAMVQAVQRPLATDRVRHVGDGVAYIVAETRAQAKDAAELIEVDYEPLPSITDTGSAPRPDAPVVWEEAKTNVAYVFNQGDQKAVDEAFAKAAHVVKQRLIINRLSANPMETRGIVADYDPKKDFCTIYLGNQNAFNARTQIAKGLLHLPEEKFRVIAGDVGGSFGMKGAMYAENPLTVWASHRIGRPVKWVSERSEAFVSDSHARDKVVDAEMALDKDYKILAMRVHAISNVGSYYSTMTTFPIILSTSGLAGPYTTPHIHFKATAVFTNTNPTTPYRGSGRPDAAYIGERMIDFAARELGVDPAEIRRRNFIQPAQMPYQTPLGAKYDSGDFPKNQEIALAKADYAGFAARRKESEKRGKLRGLGIGNNVEGAAPPGQEAAKAEIGSDGSVTLYVGSTDQGQGHATMYTQIACEQLGVTQDQVRVTEGDTATLETGGGAGGSKVSSLGASAVYEAIRLVLEKGKTVAARAMEAAEADVAFENGAFAVKGTDKRMTLAETAKREALSAAGVIKTTSPTYPSGCHVCEVEIDRDTGHIAVLRYVAVTDIGRAINPNQTNGQIHGGIVQALGQVLSENIAYDPETGQLLSGSFMDYGMPRGESVCAIECYDNPVPTKINPLGVKGAGEIGAGCAVPAIMNAVADALSPLGIHHIDMPCTAERVWRAIHGVSRA